jgi:hypothetical protein
MRKVDDGYEVAGYQMLKNGAIWHATEEAYHNDTWSKLFGFLKACPDCDHLHITDENFIRFDRIDRWTGLKYPDDRLVFERDKVITKQGAKGYVIFKEYMFKVVIPEWIGKHGFRHIYRENTLLHARGMGIAFLGIEGAAKEQQSSKSAKEVT